MTRSTRNTAALTALDAALVLLGTARLTRAVTTDDIGEWLLRAPLESWADEREPEEVGWRTKLVSGADCPHCVGYWIGTGVLAVTLAVRHTPTLGPAWRFVLASLGLNTAVAVGGGLLHYWE